MPSLDLHRASDDERLAAYRNVHDVWAGGLPLEQHVERRLASVQHNRADWYVGCLDGRVVASLAAYPLRFHVRGKVVEGFSIGSVHTLAEFRGRGYAAELIHWVEAARRETGARLALLYSDIACSYYARLGYVECPAWEGSRPLDQPLPPRRAASDRWRLEPCEPEETLDTLARLYDAYHGSKPIAVARTPEYWRYTLAKSPRDRFCLLVDVRGSRHGYVRFTCADETWRIHDFALAGDTPDLQHALLQQSLAYAALHGAERLAGWLPDWPLTRSAFDLTLREQEVTMLKPLDAGQTLDAEAIASTHCFCEIDHV